MESLSNIHNINISQYKGCKRGFMTIMEFFFFYQNGVVLKKIINIGKSCQLSTTLYAKVVLSWHDFVNTTYYGTYNALQMYNHYASTGLFYSTS